jgi:hypothetical protein
MLTVTSDATQVGPGGTIQVTVVRDPAEEGTVVDYPITFNEISTAGGTIVDTGDITLEVLIPAGTGTTIQPQDPSGLLAITELSDDGTTVVFGVVFPGGAAPAVTLSPAADPVPVVVGLGADPVGVAVATQPAPGQITRTASGARQVTG